MMANWQRRMIWECDYEDGLLIQRVPGLLQEWHRPHFYRLWRFWFRVVRRMTFHRYLIQTRDVMGD